jgi:hypothetical protein
MGMTKEEIAAKAKELLSGEDWFGSSERFVVSVPEGYTYDDRIGVWVSPILARDYPTRVIAISESQPKVMAFGVVNGMFGDKYFNNWLDVATTSIPDGPADVAVADVIIIKPEGERVGTINDVLGVKTPEDAMMLTEAHLEAMVADEIYRATVRDYSRIAEECRSLLGEEWYRDVIIDMPFVFIEQQAAIIRIIRKVIEAAPPEDGPRDGKTYHVVADLIKSIKLETVTPYFVI